MLAHLIDRDFSSEFSQKSLTGNVCAQFVDDQRARCAQRLSFLRNSAYKLRYPTMHSLGFGLELGADGVGTRLGIRQYPIDKYIYYMQLGTVKKIFLHGVYVYDTP